MTVERRAGVVPVSSALIDSVLRKRADLAILRKDRQEARKHIPELQELTAGLIRKHIIFPSDGDIKLLSSGVNNWGVDANRRELQGYHVELDCDVPVEGEKSITISVRADTYPSKPDKTQYVLQMLDFNTSFILKPEQAGEKIDMGLMGLTDVRDYRDLIGRLMQDDVRIKTYLTRNCFPATIAKYEEHYQRMQERIKKLSSMIQ